MLLLAACAAQTPSPPSAAAVAVPKEALPLDEAVMRLAEATLAVEKNIPPGTRRTLVIDPLIDRASGAETTATRAMASRIAALARDKHPELELKPFTLAALDEKPLILLGAITAVTEAGSLTNSTEASNTYRIWAVLGDVQTGMILSHPTAWVRAETVDATPTAFFRDSVTWTDDEAKAAYLRTCAGAPGTPMDPAYLRGLRAQAVVAEGIQAYERGDMASALAFYRQADGEPSGQQLRVLNGLYLANLELGQRDAARDAFGRVVDYGLGKNRLGLKLLFRPGGTAFVRDPGVSAAYPMWLEEIASRVAQRETCLRVTGHASMTGASITNDRLSLARAQAVRATLVRHAPPLRDRSDAVGRGSREPIVGLGTDDMRDALDRRVEFTPRRCQA
ncbi:OmpA family protein [Belnapia sp. T18]|uniref:OmpA family protein n=1 Tax=Belnapia arida TaxID=2804533 RepID=A0ABS1U8T2_9PROT|nr:OmpA family protein [Belnapia arida]MBL6081080.1 OmpA family protein [Belnapia arida]